MRPALLAALVLGLLGVGAVFSLVAGPSFDPQANPTMGQREGLAALLGLALLAFVAFGWDGYLDP